MSGTPIRQTGTSRHPKLLGAFLYAGIGLLSLFLSLGAISHSSTAFSASAQLHQEGAQHFPVVAGYQSSNGKTDHSIYLYVEVAEEDDIPDEYQIHGLQQKNFSHHEWGYSSFINALYLQLSFSLQRQAEEPLLSSIIPGVATFPDLFKAVFAVAIPFAADPA